MPSIKERILRFDPLRVSPVDLDNATIVLLFLDASSIIPLKINVGSPTKPPMRLPSKRMRLSL